MRRVRLLALGSAALSLGFAALTLGCSGGGGGGGSSGSAGPLDWGVPFVASDSARFGIIVLHNLDSHGATATVTHYNPDGTIDGAPILVTLDGEDEHHVAIASNTGGMALVNTPTRQVEVAFDVVVPGELAEEASRAWPLGDLAAPPPTTTAASTITGATTRLQLSNASAAATVVTVTAYREPPNPADPPTTIVGTPIALAAFESVLLNADTVTGISSYLGSIVFSAPVPIFAATEEGGSGALGFEGVPQFQPKDRSVAALLNWGLDSIFPNTYTDFALVLRNDADVARTVTIDRIQRGDGVELLASPRQVSVSAHTTRTLPTTEYPFDDIFGDVTLFASLTHPAIQISVPADVAATFRQFNPQIIRHLMTVRPAPLGHVFDVMDIETVDALPSLSRTFVHIYNPTSSSITVNFTVLIPEPDGFAAGQEPLPQIVIGAGATAIVSLDGLEFLDRDDVVQSSVVLRVFCNAPCFVASRKEVRDFASILQILTPRHVRELDDPE